MSERRGLFVFEGVGALMLDPPPISHEIKIVNKQTNESNIQKRRDKKGRNETLY